MGTSIKLYLKCYILKVGLRNFNTRAKTAERVNKPFLNEPMPNKVRHSTETLRDPRTNVVKNRP